MIDSKTKKKRNLIIAGTILIVIAGVVGPGVILLNSFWQQLNTVTIVEAKADSQYKSATSVNASSKLTYEEKISLLSGKWGVDISELDAYECETNMADIADTAKDLVKKINQLSSYPRDFTSRKKPWFRWEISFFQGIETTFHTYSTRYYRVMFKESGGEEWHIIYMLEDGQLIGIVNNIPDETLTSMEYQKKDNLIILGKGRQEVELIDRLIQEEGILE